MVKVAYTIVEHDGGWAYKLDGVFSETFASRAVAESAAAQVAAEQRVPGDTEAIAWQDSKGIWHEELESGEDRPEAYVEHSNPQPFRSDLSNEAAEQRTRFRRTTIDRYPLATVIVVGVAGYLLSVIMQRQR